MCMLAPTLNMPAQIGELYGVTYFAFRSVKFPACLSNSMLCKWIAGIWDQELCTARCTGSQVESWLSTLAAWPDLELTWPSWNSGCCEHPGPVVAPPALDNLCSVQGWVSRQGVAARPEVRMGGSQDACIWPLASKICFGLSFSSSHFYSSNPQSPCSIFTPSLAKPWSN